VTRSGRGWIGTAAIVVLVLVTAALVLRALTADDADGDEGRTVTIESRARDRDVAGQLCGAVDTTVSGRIAEPALRELSGLVASRRQPGILWAHNDSGDAARVYALDPQGTARGTWDVPGALAVDWEDLAVRGGTLYLADIGDNSTARAGVQVYAVPEPKLPTTPSAAPLATEPATGFELRYPDRAHDAETLLVDPRTGDGFVVTKALDGTSGVFRFPPLVAGEPAPGPITMEAVGTLRLGVATGGDVTATGDAVAVRTYADVYVWNRARGQSVAEALATPPCVSGTPIPAESRRQVEALAFQVEGVGYYTVGEATRAAIDHVTPRAGASTSRPAGT
jgi:hypothetical protein